MGFERAGEGARGGERATGSERDRAQAAARRTVTPASIVFSSSMAARIFWSSACFCSSIDSRASSSCGCCGACVPQGLSESRQSKRPRCCVAEAVQ
mgnify:CR=1 FL=1